MRSGDSIERWTAGGRDDIHRTAVSGRALGTADIPGAGMGLTERIAHASAVPDGIGAAEPGSALICRRQVRRAAPLAARRHSLGRQGSANRSSRCVMAKPAQRDAGLGRPNLRGRTVPEVPGDRCCHLEDEADRPPELGLGEWEGRGGDANGSDDPACVAEDWRADARGVLIEVPDTDVVASATNLVEKFPDMARIGDREIRMPLEITQCERAFLLRFRDVSKDPLGRCSGIPWHARAQLGEYAHRLAALGDGDADRTKRVGDEEGCRLFGQVDESPQVGQGYLPQIHPMADDHAEVEETHSEAVPLRFKGPLQGTARCGIVTVLESVIHLLDNLATVSGVAAMLASIRQVGIPVLELNGDGDATFVRLIEVCRRSVGEDQADGFVLGCGTLSFRAAKLQEVVGVSVVNPLQVALRAADMLVGCNLTHSKRSYPVPLKLAPEALAVGG